MTSSPLGKTYAAFLFDMDGTLLSSLEAAERVWSAWGERHGLDLETFLPTIHGRRAPDTIRAQNLKGIDLQAEIDWVTQGELADTDGIVAIKGVQAFLNAIPKDRWAIVTSAPRELARVRLEAAGITPPAIMVAGEDIEIGKPSPDCFLEGAKRLGVDAADCLIFEDAPAGIEAGERARADLVVITATHQHGYDGGHFHVENYEGLGVVVDGNRVGIAR